MAVIAPPLVLSTDSGPVDAAQGIGYMMADANIPYDLLDIGKNLNEYKVIIANGYAWSDAQLQKLLDFARAGGTVIAMDERFAARNEQYVEVQRPDLAALKTDGTHKLGSGQFIFFRDYLGWKYWDHKDAAAFNFIYNAVKTIATPNTAGAGVQIIPYISGNNIVVHILNDNYANNAFTTQINVPVSVKIPGGLTAQNKTLTLLSPDGKAAVNLEYTVEAGWLKFTVPELYIWSVVVLK